MPVLQQPLAEMSPQKTGAPCYQNSLH
jgi:hypothetical protein